jgi:hypothetical protein
MSNPLLLVLNVLNDCSAFLFAAPLLCVMYRNTLNQFAIHNRPDRLATKDKFNQRIVLESTNRRHTFHRSSKVDDLLVQIERMRTDATTFFRGNL